MHDHQLGLEAQGAAMAKLSTASKTIARDDGTKVELTTALNSARRIDTAYEIYLSLYQAITGPEDAAPLDRFGTPLFWVRARSSIHRMALRSG